MNTVSGFNSCRPHTRDGIRPRRVSAARASTAGLTWRRHHRWRLPNVLRSNLAALKRAFESGGPSLVLGLRSYLR